MLNVVDGLVVYDKVIEKRLMSELPFMATENIMMDSVKAGGNRQELHEEIRKLSMKAGENVKKYGKDNNLLELIADDDKFPVGIEELNATMDPAKYVGRSASQVTEFLENIVNPILVYPVEAVLHSRHLFPLLLLPSRHFSVNLP